MMRTTILVTAVLVSMLSASAVFAQKVEATLEDEHPVINCEGMPLEAYTTTTKGNTEAVLKTAATNKTVYKRFAVHKSNNNTWSSWSNAFTVCSDLGASWRLPTQRELQLIWVLKSALEKASGFSPITAVHYWSTMEYNSRSSWYVHLGTGFTSNEIKTYNYQVRCVKEL